MRLVGHHVPHVVLVWYIYCVCILYGARSADGDREHPGNASQSCAGPSASGTRARCKCGWRTAFRGRFSRTEWEKWWNHWATYAKNWWRTTLDHGRWLCARLLIPNSLMNTIPQHQRRRLCSVVGPIQSWAMLGVQGLQRWLVAPTPDLPPSPLCITRFSAQHFISRETPQNLRNAVGAPTGQIRKRKRSTSHDEPVIDVDTWLHEARQANDHEAVQWFTRTIFHQETTRKKHCKRPRTLNALHNCQTTTLRRREDLACKHLHVTKHTYFAAATCAHAMKHLRDLRSMYDNTIKAKGDYHEVVDARLRDAINITRTHQRWQQCVAYRQETCHGAKQEALPRTWTTQQRWGCTQDCYTICTVYKHTRTDGWGIHNRYTTMRSTGPSA